MMPPSCASVREVSDVGTGAGAGSGFGVACEAILGVMCEVQVVSARRMVFIIRSYCAVVVETEFLTDEF